MFQRWKKRCSNGEKRSFSTAFYSDKKGVSMVFERRKKVVASTVRKRCYHSIFLVTKKVF